MAIKLKRQASGSVVRPPASHVAFFIDQDGNPSLMNSEGTVSPSVTADGSPLSLTAQISAPTPVELGVKLYSKSVSGVVEFFVIDDQGNEIQITNNGSVNAGGRPTLNWKNDEPGNYYVDGDEVDAEFNTIIMVNVSDPDIVVINLPAITEASAGMTIGVRNASPKKVDEPGMISLVPDAADSFEDFAVGEQVWLSETEFIHHTFESDGVGRWSHSVMGGGPLLWTSSDPGA